MFLRSLATAACCTLLATATYAMPMGQSGDKALPSPPATAEATLSGKTITIHYNSPRLKGRTIGSDIVPYGEVWRTGANPATTLITRHQPQNRHPSTSPPEPILSSPSPNKDQWLFIVSKKTGEWGIPYPEGNDLGRTPMTAKPMPASQENMSITFENTHGATTELHVKWGTTDQYVTIKAQ
ncbi:MAG: DUF2911 domain-containing protein [Edaphobacter sp.]